MKLVKAESDYVYGLPLRNPEVYFTEDKQIKIVVSYPMTGMFFVSISYQPLTDKPPPERLCKQILFLLGLQDGVLYVPPSFLPVNPGIIRYTNDLKF